MVEALSAGQEAEFIFAERAIYIELNESRWALSVFVAHCLWQQAQAKAYINISQAAVPVGASNIYNRRHRGYVLGCVNTPGLNGRTVVFDSSGKR